MELTEAEIMQLVHVFSPLLGPFALYLITHGVEWFWKKKVANHHGPLDFCDQCRSNVF